MSLYYVQKAIYELNRSDEALAHWRRDAASYLADFDLTDEERMAMSTPDIGLLYVMGVNGQLLMHFAAAAGQAWDAYLNAMREGLRLHGPVREGVYKTVGEKA
ncbi:aromatic ring-opening dioxygenase LigA [Comamonas composti]|uniref:aromatic ring-opening dioxygenase LigA n=1 Tax=Comamonas composti TaxID=408558 RepID=UPI0003FB4A6A|nr:aromatic ring-opening dioxygenase LigA [Comamonas composti]